MAWQTACLNEHKPTALLLSRQKLPVLHKYAEVIHENAGKGAYVLDAGKGTAKAVIIATGSEVHVALEAQAKLAEEGICVSGLNSRAKNINSPYCLRDCRRLPLKPA